MTHDRRRRTTRPPVRQLADRRRGADGRRDAAAQTASHPPRPGLDHDDARRQGRDPADGLARRGPDPGRDRGARRATTPTAATAVIVGDAPDQRDAARGRRTLITRTIATQSPVARDLRFLLVARPRQLRARADGRPRGVGRQAGPQARAASRRSSATSSCRRWASSPRRWSAASCGALVDIDVDAARAVAARDDEIDDLYHRTFDEVVDADAGRSRTTSSAGRGSCSRPTTSSGSATGSRTSPRTSCSSPAARSRTSTHDATPPIRILVLCTGNSCRSILAEALFRELGGDRVAVESAGQPAEGVSTRARSRVLDEAGIDHGWARSKSMTEFLDREFDHVLTVCDDAAEVCPVFPGPAVRTHWSIPDPARARGHGRRAPRRLPRRRSRTCAGGSRRSSLRSAG